MRELLGATADVDTQAASMTKASYQRAASFDTQGASALPGLFFILTGTLAALLLVPEHVQEKNALVEPAICMTLGLLAPVMLRLRGDPASAFKVENALMAAIVYWLLFDLLQAAYPYVGIGQKQVITAFSAVGLFAAAIWLGAAGRGWHLPSVIRSAAERSLNNRMLFLAIVVSFVLGMFDFAFASGFDPFVMIEGVISNRWAAPWSRGQFGGWEAFLGHLQYFGYPLPALCVMLAQRRGWLRPQVVVAIALAAIMLLFLSQSGGRRIVGLCVGSALFTWLAAQQTLRLKTFVWTGLTVMLLLVFMQEMLRYRNIGFAAWLAGEKPELHISHWGVDDNFNRLSQIITIFPDYHPYVYHRPILHALTLPIPRVVWPDKPTDPGFDLAKLVGLSGVSLTSSIIGELYASFGFLTVLLGGLVMGRLAGMWNKVLSVRGDSKALMFGLGLMVLFAGLRSVQGLVLSSYMVLGWLAVSAVLHGRTSAGNFCNNSRDNG